MNTYHTSSVTVLQTTLSKMGNKDNEEKYLPQNQVEGMERHKKGKLGTSLLGNVPW